MYLNTQSLCQRPMARICHSGTPAAAAVVAAPMRNEWPAYSEALRMPARSSRVRTLDVKVARVKGTPDAKQNRGLSLAGHVTAKYSTIAMTGQYGVVAPPICRTMHLAKRSVLERFTRNYRMGLP